MCYVEESRGLGRWLGFQDWSPGWFHEVGPGLEGACGRSQWLLSAGAEAALFSILRPEAFTAADHGLSPGLGELEEEQMGGSGCCPVGVCVCWGGWWNAGQSVDQEEGAEGTLLGQHVGIPRNTGVGSAGARKPTVAVGTHVFYSSANIY